MGPIGTPELLVIGILALLVFGPKRLPEIGKNVGAAIREFRRASRDIMSHFEDDEPPRVRSVGRYGYQTDPYPAMTADTGSHDAYAASTAGADTPADDDTSAPPAEADPAAAATADGDPSSLTAANPAGTSAAEAERKA